jgi:cytoskeletal protein CcmA (bactofilin family)
MIWKREDAGSEQEERREPVHEEPKGGRRMADGGEVTVIGQAAKLEGTVVSAGSLRIDGQVKGQINADGDVALTPQSQVEADIRAQNVSVAGRFKGSILVKGRAEINRGGRVDGNITSKSLVVEEGAIFQGQSIMDQQAQAQQGQQAQASARQQAQQGEAAEKARV